MTQDNNDETGDDGSPADPSGRLKGMLESLDPADRKWLVEFVSAEAIKGYEETQLSGPPFTQLELMITNGTKPGGCNCACDYCFELDGSVPMTQQIDPAAQMTPEQGVRYVTWFLDQVPAGTEDIAITTFGGEPLVRFDTIQAVVEYVQPECNLRGIRVDWRMTTNGTLLSERRMKWLSDHGINYLLSLDGDKETQDRHRRLANGDSSFDIVFPKIPTMLEYQRRLGTRMTPMPDTIGKLLSNVVFLYNAGIRHFQIGPGTGGITWSSEALGELAKQYLSLADFYVQMKQKDPSIRITIFESEGIDGETIWGCRAGISQICITCEGQLFPCSRILGVKGREMYDWGNLENGGFKPKNRPDWSDSRSHIRGKCRTCRIRKNCRGGCPVVNLERRGTIYLPNPMDCFMNKLMVELAKLKPEAFAIGRPQPQPVA